MLKKLFGEPELTGLESDAYWLGLFLGVVASFGVTFVLLFSLVPAGLATELSPVLLVVALVLSYPLARGFQRLLARGLRAFRAWSTPPATGTRKATDAFVHASRGRSYLVTLGGRSRPVRSG